MTGKSKIKGDKGERAAVTVLKDAGYTDAVRVPLSGAVKSDDAWRGDIKVTIQGKTRTIEVKSWARNFPEYAMLEEADMVFKRTIRRGTTEDWLVTMRLEDLFTLLKDGER